VSFNVPTVETSGRSKKRVLFVCTHNRVRSLTAAQVYGDRPDLEVRSAGIDEYASVPLTRELFDWADQVFVFSERQRKVVEERFPSSLGSKSVVCLHLADTFDYKSPKLVIKLVGKLTHYLGEPAHNEWQAGQESSPQPLPPPVTENLNDSEREFIREMAKPENLLHIDHWLRNPAIGCVAPGHAGKNGEARPRGEFAFDFLLKQGDAIYVVVVRSDKEMADPAPETVRKRDCALDRFQRINDLLEGAGIPTRYHYTALSPRHYHLFFQRLRKGDAAFFRSEPDAATAKTPRL
jgi:predicted protein tyrosine phosphatase